MDLLVVGGSGFLGREITRQAQPAGHRVVATFHTRDRPVSGVSWRWVDIRSRDDVTELVRQTRPDVVINAAYRKSDWATTACGGMHVALASSAADARLVHVSSDMVFSGAAASYDETCLPDPTTPYGAAKAAAETAIAGVSTAAVIARTSLIVGNGDSQHERFVHGLASGLLTGTLFTDDVRCPVHVSDLARALLELADSSHVGIHHVAGGDPISRYQLGVLIAQRDGLDPSALPAGERAAANLPGPIHLRMDCTSTQARLTTRLRGAREFLVPTSA